MYKGVIKPFFDLALGLSLGVIVLPVFILVCIIVFLDLKENPIFIQIRPGYSNKLFRIRKFKTMNSKRDSFGKLLSDSERLTKIGIFLRKLSIDEIPQIFNVLKGEMSFVGPRPLLPEYLELYSEHQIRRHNVKPGITGWAQVNGRNSISWEDKFELDVWYVDNQNILLDIKILFLTFLKVLKREGVYSSENKIMPRFDSKMK